MRRTETKSAEEVYRELIKVLTNEMPARYRVESEHSLDLMGRVGLRANVRPDIVLYDQDTDYYVFAEVKGSQDTDLPLATAPIMADLKEAYKVLDPDIVLVSLSHVPPLLKEQLAKYDVRVIEYKDTRAVILDLLDVLQAGAARSQSRAPHYGTESDIGDRGESSEPLKEAHYDRTETGSIEVEAPVQHVFDYWKTLENLPQFMTNVEEIRPTGPDTTHWVVKGPLGTRLEFDARTTQDEANEAIGWNTIEGDVQTSGRAHFEEIEPHRTRVEAQITYPEPPGGKVSKIAHKIVADPQIMMQEDLRNFKEIIEGTATPEEIQQRPAATAQSRLVSFLTTGTGLLVLGGGFVLWLLLRRRGNTSGRDSSLYTRRPRMILEFEREGPC